MKVLQWCDLRSFKLNGQFYTKASKMYLSLNANQKCFHAFKVQFM